MAGRSRWTAWRITHQQSPAAAARRSAGLLAHLVRWGWQVCLGFRLLDEKPPAAAEASGSDGGRRVLAVEVVLTVAEAAEAAATAAAAAASVTGCPCERRS